jgi:hypothetical protein
VCQALCATEVRLHVQLLLLLPLLLLLLLLLLPTTAT